MEVFNDAYASDLSDAFEKTEEEQRKLEEEELLRQQQIEAQRQQELQQENAINDPGDVVKEVGNAIVGGVAQTVEDVITAPERLIDLATGQVAGENYEPDWNPVKADRFKTQTWWGGMIKSAINVGSIFIPVGGAVGAFSKGAKGTQIVRGAFAGVVTDSLMESSVNEDNISGTVIKHAPWLEPGIGWLATKPEDHPTTKLFKNVVEGMGIGAVLDAVLIKNLAPGEAAASIGKRSGSVAEQTVERAKIEYKQPGFGGHKNKPVADISQGNAQSKGKPSDIKNQLDQIDTDPSAADGSTDGFVTPAQRARAAQSAEMSEEVFLEQIREVVSDQKFAEMDAEIKAEVGGAEVDTLKTAAARRADEILNGRNTQEMTLSEFIEPLENAPKQITPQLDGDPLTSYSTADIITADIIIGSLTKQIRDMAIASREFQGTKDLMDLEGPMALNAERLKYLLYQVKRARRIKSVDFASLRKDSSLESSLKKDLANMKEETDASIDFMIDLMRKDESGELTQAVNEYLSMGAKITSVTDLDNFFRQKMGTGFSLDNKILIRELQAMGVHSILSGPKTPLRAITGTSTGTANRLVGTALGGILRGDIDTARASIAATGALIQAIPESFKIFKARFKGYWSGDVATMKTRYSQYEKQDRDFKAMGAYIEMRGTDSEKAAFRLANMARQANANGFLRYAEVTMAATDDAFKVLMARARAKEQAVREVLESKGTLKMDAATIKAAEDRFYDKLTDSKGNINLDSDVFLKSVYEEATLTAPLEGWARGMETLFNQNPLIKPFFLFARTGINGLAFSMKNTPLLNMALTKQRKIFFSDGSNLEELAQYGIRNASDLANEKALMAGRQAMGSAVVFMGVQSYLNGDLRGNGPQDRSLRNAWKQAGWRPNEVKIGGVWVSTRQFEPWAQVLDIIADIGDHQSLMGDKWVEDSYMKLGWLIGTGMVNKTYLNGITQLTDLFSGEYNQAGRIAGNLMNNTLPLGSLRNEIGKFLKPGMFELNNSILEQIRSRNAFAEYATSDPLPMKYDILNGEVIRSYDFMTRALNAVNPFTINFGDSPGRELFFNSRYDMTTSVMVSPRGNGIDGINLRQEPVVRSMFAKAIGDQNIEKQLNKLAKDPKIKASLREMQRNMERGLRGDMDPMSYYHNRMIKRLMDRARKIAWAQVSQTPEAQALISEARRVKRFNLNTTRQTGSYTINNMYK